MASIKKIKTSNQFKNDKQNINSNNFENLMNNEEMIKNNYIEKSFLKELLKCEICENVFDLNIHNNTFKQNYACPLDNIKNAFNIESCVINLRVELIIKKIFQKEEKTIQKKIVYSKPDVKKVNQNTLSNENYSNKKNGEFGYKKYEEINDNLNTPQIEEEMNVKNKLLFEDEKIKGVMINETIDTIRLYYDKSFEIVSFKEDVNDLFEKTNLMPSKYPFHP